MKCPDCKDGFYYPLIGPPEPCSTCATPDIPTDIPAIFVPRDTGIFVCNDQRLGEILEINVLDYGPLAVRFDGGKTIEYTDPQSKEFREIVDYKPLQTWWGNRYIVEHAIAGLAKFNYKPIDFIYHFHGPCKVTLKKMTNHNYRWYRKTMTQL